MAVLDTSIFQRFGQGQRDVYGSMADSILGLSANIQARRDLEEQRAREDAMRAQQLERQAAQDQLMRERFNMEAAQAERAGSLAERQFGLEQQQAQRQQARQDFEMQQMLQGVESQKLAKSKERDMIQKFAPDIAAQLGLGVDFVREVGDFDTLKKFSSGIPGAMSSADKTKIEQGLRKEFTGLTKGFRDVADSYGRIRKASPTAAGDISLIFNFMKMNDPGSVVREGEFATAQNAAGIPERVRAAYNRALEGTRLTPEQRADFMASAENLYQSQLESFNRTSENYSTLAQRAGVDAEDVVVDFRLAEEAAEIADDGIGALLDKYAPME